MAYILSQFVPIYGIKYLNRIELGSRSEIRVKWNNIGGERSDISVRYGVYTIDYTV